MSRTRGWADAVAAVGCGVLGTLLVLRPFFDMDYHWHLAVGRYIAGQHALPTQNLWSFTTPEHPFSATSWLFDLLAYWLWSAGGDALVHVVVALFSGATLVVLYLTCRKLEARLTWSLALIASAALLVAPRFVPRPQVVSYLLITLTAHWLVLAWQGRRWPLFAVPALIAVWSNFHAGAVFGTGAVVGLFAAVLVLRWQKVPAPLSLRAAAACLGASVLGAVANPSGLELIRYGAFHLKDVNSVVVLSEFMRPGLDRYAAFWVILLLGAGLAGWEFKRRPQSLLGSAWLASFGVLAVRAIRVVPHFLWVSVPFIASAATRAEDALARRLGEGRSLQAARWSLPFLLPLLTVLVSEFPATFWIRPLALGVEPANHPEQMARWVEAQGLQGRCFASWDVSGFVEYRLPQSPVFVDPRLRAYPASLFQQLEKADDDQALFDALMNQYQVEWAFRGNTPLRLSGLGRFRDEAWAVVYWDETGQVMLRRTVPRFAPIVEREEFRFFRPGRDLLKDYTGLTGEDRTRWETELERVAAHSANVVTAQIGLCLVRTRRGALAEAAGACERASQIIEDRHRVMPGSMRTSLQQLAVAYAQLGDGARRGGQQEAARAAYLAALAASADAVGALAGLGFLELADNPRQARAYFQQALTLAPRQPQLLQGLAQAEANLRR